MPHRPWEDVRNEKFAMNDSESFYTEVAKRFFNQFLEMKVRMENGELRQPDGWERELRQYKSAIKELKMASQDLVAENDRLSEQLAIAESELAELRASYNQTVIDMGRLQEKLKGLGLVRTEAERVGYSFVEHMSEESRRAWETLMKEIPRPGV
jgi:chromosome segregation ATPase